MVPLSLDPRSFCVPTLLREAEAFLWALSAPWQESSGPYVSQDNWKSTLVSNMC